MLSLELCVQRRIVRCNEREPSRSSLWALLYCATVISPATTVEFNARCAYLRCGDGGHASESGAASGSPRNFFCRAVRVVGEPLADARTSRQRGVSLQAVVPVPVCRVAAALSRCWLARTMSDAEDGEFVEERQPPRARTQAPDSGYHLHHPSMPLANAPAAFTAVSSS